MSVSLTALQINGKHNDSLSKTPVCHLLGIMQTSSKLVGQLKLTN